MLYIKDADTVIGSVNTGECFTLPNGDAISPAYAGWTDGRYYLEEAPIQPITRLDQELSRKFCYANEADPLFFLAQRGEATTEEWLAKIAEIKARYPYPEA